MSSTKIPQSRINGLQEDLLNKANVTESANSLAYEDSKLTLKAKDGTELSTVEIVSGGAEVTVDGQTISYSEESKLQSIGVLNLNKDVQNFWMGTKAEYEQAVADGTITETTICQVTDDEEDLEVSGGASICFQDWRV